MEQSIQHSFTILEWLGIIGSIASIISIVLNIIQLNINKDLKKILDITVCSSESGFNSIKKSAEENLDGHAIEKSSNMKIIIATANQVTNTLSQIKIKWLK
ncbi:MAG: hypothetical protein P9L92_01665 [Candidatus Electryonea clarkiae]|nr:hypothetical protein [Candidatus Electryonea clarkiae]MDP8285382.1 hypothetical protein [Candidatus Electryonea clarkiae]